MLAARDDMQKFELMYRISTPCTRVREKYWGQKTEIGTGRSLLLFSLSRK